MENLSTISPGARLFSGPCVSGHMDSQWQLSSARWTLGPSTQLKPTNEVGSQQIINAITRRNTDCVARRKALKMGRGRRGKWRKEQEGHRVVVANCCTKFRCSLLRAGVYFRCNVGSRTFRKPQTGNDTNISKRVSKNCKTLKRRINVNEKW